MASSARVRDAGATIRSFLADLTPQARSGVMAFLAMMSLIYALAAQSPSSPEPAKQHVVTVVSSDASETIHVKLDNGSYSTRGSRVTTVTTTTEE